MLRLFTDYRLGGEPRHYLAEKPEHFMFVPDEIRKCAVFVGYQKADDSYVKLGTAFFVSYPSVREGKSFLYLVTAKHIIARIQELALNEVQVRLNTHEGFECASTLIDSWYIDPDDYNLDVAVASVTLRKEDFDFRTIPISMVVTPQVAKDYFIGVGEDVFLTGLFSKHTGTKKNLPIIRSGTIALMADPEEPVEVNIMGVRCEIEAHLIEARSIGGLSGSPVFVHLGHIRPVKTPSDVGQIYWFGLMHGHWDVKVRPDEYEDDSTETPPQEKVNMGIAIVVPSYKVLEVIERPVFADARKRNNEQAREKDLPTPDMIDDEDENREFTEDDFERALEKVTRRDKKADDKGKGKKSK
jgi:hypothetical protein